MWSKIHDQLYINKNGNLIELTPNKARELEWMLYDPDRPDVKFPIKDIFINPIFNPNPSINTIIANERIPAFSPVTLDGRIPTSDDLSFRFNICGIAPFEIEANSQGEYRSIGELISSEWSFTPGLPLYLNGKTLSHNAPKTGFIKEFGIAKNSNTLFLNIQESIKLFS
ncbi:MAG TPA: hypothetical protein PK079_26045 [Leptospiraceae bacterium]|nr:hypothetical protein [Leptospiraceae bacterium]HMY29974.1 hypothetical protein [Leptospiraceae bacterium]HNC59931.1 hypothetical protein [Leptospiraceae bacterium]HNE11606.1 hypothetical protein [Leptospiraceae bacterium]HNE56651.1 hypothetical protein [Leptospiraceae bacterium]